MAVVFKHECAFKHMQVHLLPKAIKEANMVELCPECEDSRTCWVFKRYIKSRISPRVGKSKA